MKKIFKKKPKTASYLEKHLTKVWKAREEMAKPGELRENSVKVIIYFEVKKEKEKKRKCCIKNSDGKLLYERSIFRFLLKRLHIKNLQSIIFDDNFVFDELIFLFIHNSLDFARFYTNIGSYIRAIKITKEAEVPSGEPAENYEANKPLRATINNRNIKFPYIRNQAIFSEQVGDNSCLATLIIEKFKKSSASLKFNLNYRSLWKTCRPNSILPRNEEGYPLSLEQAETFFRKMRIKLVAIDIFFRVIKYYDPRDHGERLNTHMSPSILRILVHQGHAYEINHNVNSFDQKVKGLFEKNQLQPASTHFPIKKNFEYQQDQIILNLDELIEFIQNYMGDSSFIRVITDLNLENIIATLKLSHGVVASNLTIKNGNIDGFVLEREGILFKIMNMRLPAEEGDISIEDKTYYDAFMSEYEKIYRSLLTKNHQSFYHPQFVEVMKRYSRGPLRGTFSDDASYCKELAPYLDSNKAYTNALMKLKYLPVFDQFCTFKQFTGEEIDEYSIYLVTKSGQISNHDLLLFDRTYVLISGITLLETKIECDILYQCSPSKLLSNTISVKVRSLWNTDLQMSDKKFIMNMTMGWMDKWCNRKSRCEFFDDAMEAKCKLRDLPNATLYPIETVVGEPKWIDEVDDLEYGIEDPSISSRLSEECIQKFYLVYQCNEKLMENGFLPISFFKYDIQRLELWKMYKVLSESGLDIMGMNTDCFYLRRDIPKILEMMENNTELFDRTQSFESIGKWKYGNDSRCPMNFLEQTENTLDVESVHKEKIEANYVDGEEEWQANIDYEKNAMEIFKEKNTLILGDYPGSGKTYLAESFTRGKKHLFIAPFNNQKEDLKKRRHKAKTLYKLLGLGIDERHHNTPMDVEGIEVIVFDELLLNSRKNLWRIYQFIRQHPNIRFLATTDKLQLRAVEDCKDNIGDNEDCLDFLFTNRIRLSIIKRVDNEEDKLAYPIIKEELFRLNISPKQVIEAHPHYFGRIIMKKRGITTNNNVSLTNATRMGVNEYLQKYVLKKVGFSKGDLFICRGYIKGTCKRRRKQGIVIQKGKSMTRNRIYKIVSMKKNEVTLQDTSKTTKNFIISLKQFTESFDLPYCMTNHSLMEQLLMGK